MAAKKPAFGPLFLMLFAGVLFGAGATLVLIASEIQMPVETVVKFVLKGGF